ncbi:LacI family transcriptional regulator [Catalinimonas alkaloidigena]|uniref:LacI family transcriptional regulator n=1 Tax=Catalinimonas alkaloidigena TaxID=1075417 RepID=A0A1G9PD64_9BACT|nr:LacI family DNA-binding transcriptional regulator [Catalinimonas alkaloidigena]SDL96431.1 LacI family transcriptional regulator [Catalinimonas alkaloidigena]
MSKFLSTVDLAKALNLSPSTVSRALNDHYSISEKTKKRVLEYAREVGFQKNLNASRLLREQTFTIGIVMPEISSYFFSTVVQGLKQVLEPAGYDMLIMQTGEQLDNEVRAVRFLTSLRVDGLIYSPSIETKSYEHLEVVMKNQIPFVNLDRGLPGVHCYQVLVNDELGAFQAVQHLIQSGCRRIAHVAGPQNTFNARNRFKGYQRALEANGLPYDDALVVYTDYRMSHSMETVHQLFKRKVLPDGIFAINDEMAVGCISAARKRGLRIPQDLAVVGFDDEMYASYFYPALSTVKNPMADMGELAAKLCLEQIHEYDPERFEVKLLQPEVIIRDSSRRSSTKFFA